MKQGLLPLVTKEDFSLASWVVAPCNEAAYRWVLAASGASSHEPQMAYVWGTSGTGKTHLAHIFARAAQGVYATPESLIRQWGTSARKGVDAVSADVWVLDALESGEEAWLFDAFNLLKERGCSVLWLSRHDPTFWQESLADLASRFQSLPRFQLSHPDDDTARRLFTKWLHDDGVRIADNALTYLLARIPRDIETLRLWVRLLDEASTLHHRSLTLAFVREVLSKEVS